MTSLALLVAGIAIVDSINPSTVGPALLLALRHGGALLVLLFAAGVFAVEWLAGVVVVLGPGRFLLDRLPHPSQAVRAVLEVVAGLALIVVAAVVWRHRHRVDATIAGDAVAGRRGPLGAASLGAGIALVELPTAVPFFAALTAIVASRQPLGAQVVLVTLFCLAFVLPLLVVAAACALGGSFAREALDTVRGLVARYGTVVLTAGLAVVGAALTVVGAAQIGAHVS